MDHKKRMSDPKVQKEISEIGEINRKLQAQHKTLNQVMLVLKTYDAKLESLTDLCVEASVFGKDTFEERVDTAVGIRKKKPEETIENGDIVFINYECDDGKGHIAKDESFIVKMGSNTVVLEEALLGKPVNSKEIIYEAKYKDKPDEGLKFKIDIVKVKTKLIVAAPEPELVDEVKAEEVGENVEITIPPEAPAPVEATL